MSNLGHSWWLDFLPGRLAVDARERWRCVGGAAVGMLLTAWLCHWLAPQMGATAAWLVAPIGASAVLVFCVPSSPMAQPWAVVAGNTLCALIGVACVHLLGTSEWAAGVAVALAIASMFALRCLHPPGGASALLMVLTGVHEPAFALYPVAANSMLLVLAGIAYNTLTGRRYPHGQRPVVAAPGTAEPRTAASDLQAALVRYNQVLDVSPDDLQALLAEAEVEGYRRRMGRLSCADVMSREPISVDYGTPLQEAWRLLRQRRVKALPVIDRASRVIGVVTLADFMADPVLDLHDGWVHRLQTLLSPTRTMHTDKAEAVGQIMSTDVRVARADQPLGELVPLFASTGHHHIPVVDGERRLVGIITQSDLVAALCRQDAEAAAAAAQAS
ncbi:HPP family protein [Ideonella sp.]|uniref:HPP family protein n=1 Tax=Ideonella sp. TaxID=1929293 RepID=UPI0035B36116